MLDNLQRDPEVSLKTLLGSEEQVLNLRPHDKLRDMSYVKPPPEINPNMIKLKDDEPLNNDDQKFDSKKLYFKTIEQMVLMSPRQDEDEDRLHRQSILAINQSAREEHYKAQKSKIGKINMKDKFLLHQILENCNWINQQKSNFLPKNSNIYKEYNMSPFDNSSALSLKQSLKKDPSVKQLKNISLLTHQKPPGGVASTSRNKKQSMFSNRSYSVSYPDNNIDVSVKMSIHDKVNRSKSSVLKKENMIAYGAKRIEINDAHNLLNDFYRKIKSAKYSGPPIKFNYREYRPPSIKMKGKLQPQQNEVKDNWFSLFKVNVEDQKDQSPLNILKSPAALGVGSAQLLEQIKEKHGFGTQTTSPRKNSITKQEINKKNNMANSIPTTGTNSAVNQSKGIGSKDPQKIMYKGGKFQVEQQSDNDYQ